MIISHRHRFIFIKTKKTAGTSLEIALSAICGDADVITPISPPDERLRTELGFRGPQNYAIDAEREFYNHMPASHVRAIVGDAVWNGYFKFCFERNPWDKVISWYYWEHPREPRPTLAEFVASGRAALVGGPGGIDLYSDGEAIIVDRVCRYEDMAGELTALRERLGLSELPPLPRAKSAFRTDRRPYREVFTEAERAAIEQAFRREIALFGYRY